MRTLILVISFMISLNASSSPYTVFVTTNIASVYEYDEIENSLTEKFTLSHGEEALVTDETTINGLKFLYITSVGKGSGYILKSATAQKGDELKELLDNNGKVIAEKAQIYFKVDDTLVAQEIYISKDTEIKILSGFDNKKEFTEISVYYDKRIITGFIKTADISPYGINPNLVIGISLICTILGIVFILMGFKIVKKKKKS